MATVWTKEENIEEAAKWLKRKVELICEKDALLLRQAQSHTNYIVQVRRGGVFDCEIGYGNIGGEKNKTRPVVVLSTNTLNRGHTVVVVPLSSKFIRLPNGLPRYRNHFILLKSKYAFLDKDSVAKFEDIRSVDVVRLRQLRGNIDEIDMKKMKKSLIFTMGY